MVDVIDVVKSALDIVDRITQVRQAHRARAAVEELRAAHAREAIDGLAEIERIRASAGLGPATDLLGARRPTRGRWAPSEQTGETPPSEPGGAPHDHLCSPSSESDRAEPSTIDEDLGVREHVESAAWNRAESVEAEFIDVPSVRASTRTAPETIVDAEVIYARAEPMEETDVAEVEAADADAIEVESEEADAEVEVSAEGAPAEAVEVPGAEAVADVESVEGEDIKAEDIKAEVIEVEVETDTGEVVETEVSPELAGDEGEAPPAVAADAIDIAADRVDDTAPPPTPTADTDTQVQALALVSPPPPASPPPCPATALRDALMEAEAARGRPAEARRLYEVVLLTAARPTSRFPDTLYAALALQGTSECDAELGDLDAAMANSADAFAWAQRAHAEHPSEETLQVLSMAAQAHAQISERASDRPQFIEVLTGCLAVIERALERRESLAARQVQLGLRARLLKLTRPQTHIRKGAVTPASLTLTTLQGVRP